jgi:hypothetical protein
MFLRDDPQVPLLIAAEGAILVLLVVICTVSSTSSLTNAFPNRYTGLKWL